MKVFKKTLRTLILIGMVVVIAYNFYDTTHNIWQAFGLCVITLICLILTVLFINWLQD